MPFNAFPIDTTPFTDFEFLGENRTKLRTQPERIGDVVNAAEFDTFHGDGVSDDIDALDAAIAAAINEGKQTVIIPDGATCLISRQLFCGNASNPTSTSFSINLMGAGGLGQNTSTIGSRILASFNDDTAILFGPGINCSISNLYINSNVSASHPLLRNTAATAIGFSEGVGFTAYGLRIANFYTGFKSGIGGTTLSEHIALNRIEMAGCAVGIDISESQNREVAVNDSRIAAVTAIKNVTLPTTVRGGQFGDGTDPTDATFTIGSISALTRSTSAQTIGYYEFPSSAGVSMANYYTFNVTVSGPSAFEESMLAVNGYGALGISTASYGIVPCCPVSYNSGTNVLSLIIWPYWNMGNYGSTNIKTATTLEAELQAATTMYAAVWVQFFVGTGFNISGIYSEQESRLVTAIGATGEGSSNMQAQFGWAISNGNLASNDPARVLQRVFPFMLQHSSSDLVMDCCSASDNTGEKVIVDQYGSGNQRLAVRNSPSFTGVVNERVMFNSNFGASAATWANSVCRGFGGVQSDRPLHTVFPNNAANGWVNQGSTQSPFMGSRPMLYVTPQVAQTLLNQIATGAVADIPLLWGGQTYRIQDFNTTVPSSPWIIGSFNGFTYGRDFDGAPGNFSAVTFNAVGTSNLITLSDTSMAKAGWVLVLNNGAVDNQYVCIAVYPSLDQISVIRIGSDSTTNTGFNGTAGTGYTGNVKQQAYTTVLKP